jgi:hypothetical protein
MAVTEKNVVVKAVRSPQWNETRRAIFLEALAASSNVAASERKAKMPRRSSYRERVRSPEFRTAWQVALEAGYARLEMEMLERALKGIVKRVTKSGDGSEMTEYSDRTGMMLLVVHQKAVMAARQGTAVREGDTAKAQLARKLADMHDRLSGEG